MFLTSASQHGKTKAPDPETAAARRLGAPAPQPAWKLLKSSKLGRPSRALSLPILGSLDPKVVCFKAYFGA